MNPVAEQETISVVRTSPGSWDGTFHVVLSAMLQDLLSDDAPTTVRVRMTDGRLVAGTLDDVTDDVVRVRVRAATVRTVDLERDEIVSVTA